MLKIFVLFIANPRVFSMQILIQKNLTHDNQTEACLVKAYQLTFEQSSSREGSIDSTAYVIIVTFTSLFSCLTMSLCFRAFDTLLDGSWPSFVSGVSTRYCRSTKHALYTWGGGDRQQN